MALREVRDRSLGPHGSPERGWDALPEVQEGSGGSSRSLGEVEWHSGKSGRCQKTLPEVRERLGGPPGSLG